MGRVAGNILVSCGTLRTPATADAGFSTGASQGGNEPSGRKGGRNWSVLWICLLLLPLLNLWAGSAAWADISITVTDSPDPVAVGTNLTYRVTVSPTDNSEDYTPDPGADDVYVSYAVPAGVGLESYPEFCSLDGPLLCDLGNVTSTTGPRSFSIVVRPTATGQVSSTFTASGEVYGGLNGHYESVDDSATVVTQVNPITATVTATDPTASEEGPDTGELTVNLNAPASEGGLIVDYAVGGTASTQEDYTALSGSVSIPEGQTSATITVTPIDDTVLEGTETVVVTLESGIGYEVGSPDSATVNILDSEISLSKVQGDGQIGSTGVPLDPFVVELLDGSGAPSPGVTVGWTLEAGDGTLSNETSSTDAQGRASTVLTPGEDTGYEVRATIDALSVSVTFNVLSDPLIVDGLNPPQREVAETVERLCPLLAQEAEIRTLTPEEQDLLDQCTALLQNSQSNPGAVREAIAAITPEEANAPAELTTRVMNTQLDNVMGRLGALRQGARGGSLTGLAFNIGGQTVPGTLLASLVPYAEGNDSANDEEGLAFGPLGVFITGSINIGDRSGSSNEAGFDFDTKGITAGVDYRFTDDLVLGVAVGYANTDVDLDNNGGDLDVNAWSASVYGTYYVMKELYVEGLASYQRDDYDQVRNVAYSLLGQQRKAKADYYGNGYTLSLGAGYDFDRGALNLGVYGRAAYTDSEIDDYRESGASGLDLKIDDQEVKSFTTSMGGRMSYAFTVTKLRAVLFPQGWFEWEHEFEDGDDKIKGVFANDPNRIKFALPTDRLDSDYFRLGLGLSAQFAHGRAAFISYETKLGADDLNEHNFSVGVRFEF